MISTETKNIIQEHFNDLPPVIQDVILHSNWQAKIRAIVQKYKLHIDQGAAIENLVLVTMLGIETPDAFIANAKEHARVNETQAFDISTEVEREIFHEIRQKLISITESHDTIDEVERVTNELTKVDDDIEQAAKKQDTRPEEVTITSKATAVRPPIVLQQKTAPVATIKSIPAVKPKIVDSAPTAKKVIPNVKPIIVSAETKAAPTSKQEAPEERVVITLKQSTPPVKQPQAVPVPPVQNITSRAPQPANTPSVPVKPVVPKHLDPIVAARLGAPVLSARNRLEMEVSESSLKAGEVASDVPTPVASVTPTSYTKVDPYRETIV